MSEKTGGEGTTDADARRHMQLTPGHEMYIGTDDEWHCMTCENKDETDAPEATDDLSHDMTRDDEWDTQ